MFYQVRVIGETDCILFSPLLVKYFNTKLAINLVLVVVLSRFAHLRVSFYKKNSVEQFWCHVKGLRSLTSKMSFYRSHDTIANE